MGNCFFTKSTDNAGRDGWVSQEAAVDVASRRYR